MEDVSVESQLEILKQDKEDLFTVLKEAAWSDIATEQMGDQLEKMVFDQELQD
jgi:hypothetical protein